jgi:hypothetical protein
MDPKFGWLQPEQEGKAAELWLRVWEAQVGIAAMGLINGSSDHDNNIPNANGRHPSSYSTNAANGGNGNNNRNGYSNGVQNGQSKVGKVDNNKARVYGPSLGFHNRMHITHQRGCPWMVPGKTYSRGPIGYGIDTITVNWNVLDNDRN